MRARATRERAVQRVIVRRIAPQNLERCHSTLAPDCLTMSLIRAVSLRISSSNCSGLEAHRLHALAGHVLLDKLAVGQHAGDGGVELRDDLLGRRCRGQEGVPGADVHVLVARLGEGRNLRRERYALVAAHREHLELAGLDMALDRRKSGKGEQDLAAEHVGHRRPRALVRDVDQIGAGQLLVHLTHHVRLAAGAEGAVAQAAAPRLRVGDQLLEAVDRHARVDDESQRHVSDGCDRREIPFDVVGQRREQHRIQHEGGVVREKQRMAVRRGFRDRVGADRGVAARPVLDHHRLAQRFRQALPHLPADDVGGAAGRVRHDDADRPGRISLRVRLADPRDRGAAAHEKQYFFPHG